MADIKYVTLENLTRYDSNFKTYVNSEKTNSLKAPTHQLLYTAPLMHHKAYRQPWHTLFRFFLRASLLFSKHPHIFS